jgi:MFS family permease
MTVSATAEPNRPSDEAAPKQGEQRALGVASGAHVLHDGYTDLVWVALPIWQAEFGLSYAAVGLLRTIYSGTLASLQIPASIVAARIGAGAVLAAGTALAGLSYVLAGVTPEFSLLVVALLLGGVGAATQHPIGSALVTRTFTGARALKAFGAYNFAGDVGKVLLPAAATSLLLIMPWRPAYALLGIVGILAAIAIGMLSPRVTPEPQAAPTEHPLREHSAADNARMRIGFRVLFLPPDLAPNRNRMAASSKTLAGDFRLHPARAGVCSPIGGRAMTDQPDLIPRLYALAVAAEISVGVLDRKHVAAIARDAAAELQHLRRRIKGLQARLNGLREGA